MTDTQVVATDLSRGHLRALQAVNTVSSLDRSAIAPMLLVMAASLHTSVGTVTIAASVYFLTYGLLQPVWGVVLARLGTIRTLQVALVGAAAAGLLSALAPGVVVLVVLRGIAGGFFGGAIPATLVYVGATVPIERRQQPLTDLMAGVAVGMAAATVAAGWAAELVSWRVMFGVTATAAAVLALLIRRLPEPPRAERERRPVRALARAAADRWVLLVLVLGFVEGAAITGTFTFVAPSVEHAAAAGAGIAGTVVAAYGVSVLAFSRVVRPLSARVSTPTLLLIGGASGGLGFTVLAVQQGVVAGVVACVLLGAAWAFMHSTLQTWATSVAPLKRAQVVPLFAASLFLGGSTGAALGGLLAGNGHYGLLFTVSAALFVPLTIASAATRRIYLRTRRGR
ncbi:MFS transporter [Blastococcus sp. CT_GayMR16]|uniref:MFS transporter n=1 Tax=Blastococcus sp. CT_GayMR16 TaxID=2559607 RepID=UPI0010732819|nr:MFS transporter [Blastococcus sp. CT_GayMR16]TFV89617.1 MFS transporter [Blastococcus sp. CT_GayMR16]